MADRRSHAQLQTADDLEEISNKVNLTHEIVLQIKDSIAQVKKQKTD